MGSVSMANTSRRVLVVGAGPAGGSTAFWLAQSGFDVVVAERQSKDTFAQGQGVDISGPAVRVIQKMGLEQKIRSGTTGEAGFALTDDDGEAVGVVGTKSSEGKGWSPTEEIEIMRGSLCSILTGAAEASPTVTYRYSCSPSQITQNQASVTAILSDTGEAEDFACIIGADGLSSSVRHLTFDKAVVGDCYSRNDVYIAFFSMPGNPETDLPNSRAQQAPGGRTILLRPADEKAERTSCYMCIIHEDARLADVAENGTVDEQRALWGEWFQDMGGLAERALEGLKQTQDLYATRIVQVKLPTWHSARCALVGDAGYGPSPLTGEGTTLALLGAYILAGELAATPDDPPAAFARYEDTLRDYVTKAQRIPLGGKAPQIGNPQSYAGVYTLRTLFKIVSWTGIWKLFGSGNEQEAYKLPEYDFSVG
ncbi:hypothetical protein LTR37_008380 [Vermiconidia calcicola]|uniref:Uncharacterized protein n=1 Tax=Vermiconidia calcicola TaxID=1690605 RepID=A0ACC3NAY8_9PEZI|nr:hypothetical protein LTR37_008380 [Vermiconidia calcicola]